MRGSDFEIITLNRNFLVDEGLIRNEGDRYYFDIPGSAITGFENVREIEIPASVMEEKERVLKEFELLKTALRA